MKRHIYVKNKKAFLKALESCYDYKGTTFITVKHKHGKAEYAIDVTWYFHYETSKKALKRVINKVKRTVAGAFIS